MSNAATPVFMAQCGHDRYPQTHELEQGLGCCGQCGHSGAADAPAGLPEKQAPAEGDRQCPGALQGRGGRNLRRLRDVVPSTVHRPCPVPQLWGLRLGSTGTVMDADEPFRHLRLRLTCGPCWQPCQCAGAI